MNSNNNNNNNTATMKVGKSKGKTFKQRKEDILTKLDAFMHEYEKFTNHVSPRNWRSTGTHFTELRGMRNSIQTFEEITEEQKAEIASAYEANSL